MNISRFLFPALSVVALILSGYSLNYSSGDTRARVHEDSDIKNIHSINAEQWEKQFHALNREIDNMKTELVSLREERADIGDLQRKLAAMDKVVTDLVFHPMDAAKKEDLPQRAGNAATAESSQRPSNPLMSQQTEEENNAFLYGKQQEFLAETVDDKWALEMNSYVEQVFENMDQSIGSLSGIECRATLCRVNIIATSQTKAEEFALLFPMQVSRLLPEINYQFEKHDDGQTSIVMYLRKGSEL